VPIGTKTAVLLPNDDFSGVAAALNTATLLNDDFTSPLAVATEGDLIFADPPYFSSSKRGTFVKYTNPAFSWKDQERLAAAIDQARGRGANFILTNADTPELETLYGGRGYLSKLARHTVISGKAAGRSKTTELLWTSFPLQV
jgi:DNA adenine methylase